MVRTRPPRAMGTWPLNGKHTKTLAAKMVKAWPRQAVSDGTVNGTRTKALASGQQTTSTIVLPEIVELGRWSRC
ncbi:hypothetical protein [Mycolicibacterium sarraceniae]|uniref:Uncharacterized protein n=1 Tax=Mycolicibacterium sarraceniae TaxID=1534348 RepID=A0A7I7SUE2_9MYCO|nr:hypothetical protein [Mycolicibacterium sarraceniae]BBY60220.1 hypothetical protein MSAR_33560 [Mycolicibacterium sarraceniae]